MGEGDNSPWLGSHSNKILVVSANCYIRFRVDFWDKIYQQLTISLFVTVHFWNKCQIFAWTQILLKDLERFDILSMHSAVHFFFCSNLQIDAFENVCRQTSLLHDTELEYRMKAEIMLHFIARTNERHGETASSTMIVDQLLMGKSSLHW